MKRLFIISSLLATISCSGNKQTRFTGSTPADNLIRVFLGIPLSDSVDFIRWYLDISDVSYSVSCTWGIGKPNTNGFMDGGKKTELSGAVKKNGNSYLLIHGERKLQLRQLNASLLHIMDDGNSLLKGNGGWGYTLNATSPSAPGGLAMVSPPLTFKDSVCFQGRTPCGIPGLIPEGKTCYKLKWLIVLYAGSEKDKGQYSLKGTAWRDEGGRSGQWEMINDKGRIMYRLLHAKSGKMLNLLQLDEGVVIFTDEKGNLLVGDHDFGYTLSRRQFQ